MWKDDFKDSETSSSTRKKLKENFIVQLPMLTFLRVSVFMYLLLVVLLLANSVWKVQKLFHSSPEMKTNTSFLLNKS